MKQYLDWDKRYQPIEVYEKYCTFALKFNRIELQGDD